jgi:hypothetical protein
MKKIMGISPNTPTGTIDGVAPPRTYSPTFLSMLVDMWTASGANTGQLSAGVGVSSLYKQRAGLMFVSQPLLTKIVAYLNTELSAEERTRLDPQGLLANPELVERLVSRDTVLWSRWREETLAARRALRKKNYPSVQKKEKDRTVNADPHTAAAEAAFAQSAADPATTVVRTWRAFPQEDIGMMLLPDAQKLADRFFQALTGTHPNDLTDEHVYLSMTVGYLRSKLGVLAQSLVPSEAAGVTWAARL